MVVRLFRAQDVSGSYPLEGGCPFLSYLATALGLASRGSDAVDVLIKGKLWDRRACVRGRGQMVADEVGKWGTYFIQRPDRAQDDDGED